MPSWRAMTLIRKAEAMEAAVEKRKFLIKRLLKDYSFTEVSDDEDD